MTATAEIEINRRDDIIRAPDAALRFSPLRQAVRIGTGLPSALPEGSSRLWVFRDREPTMIIVQLGLDDGAHTEILGGDLRRTTKS